MMKERILIATMCLTLMSFGYAEAQGASKFRRTGPSVNVSKARAPIASSSRSFRGAPRSMSSARRTTGSIGGARSANRNGSLGGARSANRNSSIGGARSANRIGNYPGLGSGSGNRRGLGYGGNGIGNGGPLGGLLEQYLYNEYGGGRNFDPYAGEKAHAKAYRDAAIANAVVNVVGILATSQQQRVHAVKAPVAPRGHVQQQRILVQEGRTEEYRVWIPQYTIPATGEVVVGHHETRQRELAPVYETREVWIPAP